jgi:hypothetical protein
MNKPIAERFLTEHSTGFLPKNIDLGNVVEWLIKQPENSPDKFAIDRLLTLAKEAQVTPEGVQGGVIQGAIAPEKLPRFTLAEVEQIAREAYELGELNIARVRDGYSEYFEPISEWLANKLKELSK